MDKTQAHTLAKLLKQERRALELSAREVARRAGINDSVVVRIEQGAVPNPRPDTLKAIAEVLGLDLADVFAAAGYVQPTGLPSFTPYLRNKYGDMPAKALRELETSFAEIAAKYGYVADGPNPGQDET